ncbi:MAG: acetyl-CoA carboxylase carboxyltransferase subunit alpha [Vampirovibrionales bacterium]
MMLTTASAPSSLDHLHALTSEDIIPLSFEKPLVELQQKIEALEALMQDGNPHLAEEVEALKHQALSLQGKLYGQLSAAQKLQIVRHPQRPNFLEWVQRLSPELWFEMHGDRAGTDDRAMIGGLAEIDGRTVVVVGTQKGRGIKENLIYNFGMASPEGYRKALRLFQHAEKFRLPIVTLVDTPGAYPGLLAEERNIGQAIALNIREMARMKTPILSIVTGEASSGGALGIGVANSICLLEHALYTVISPEGCASILWRDAKYAAQAADALKITASDLMQLGVVDDMIPEPLGGAHRHPEVSASMMKASIVAFLEKTSGLSAEALVAQRYAKYRDIGSVQLLA